jgi:hypothetical protein
VTINVGHSLRHAWWKRFSPLVRIGWYVATAGDTRPTAQTAFGVGLIATGLVVRRSQNSRNKPIYTQKVGPGETTRIRVYQGSAPPSEVIVRT